MAILPIRTDETHGFIKKLLLSPVENSPSLPALGGHFCKGDALTGIFEPFSIGREHRPPRRSISTPPFLQQLLNGSLMNGMKKEREKFPIS